MAVNKNALIRYKTIDQCLRNNMKRWSLNNLIDACSEALYQYEGKDIYVSKRTIQLDIQQMRGDKLGYNAPIEVYDRKYYRYSEEGYSIMNIPVTDTDIKIMNEAIQVLRQFKDFSLFKEMDGVLQRLEDSVHASQERNRAIIHLDKNERLKGLEYIDTVYNAILQKKVLKITYQSFKARQPREMSIHPQLLKEFNNRWFILASNKDKEITLALDRIQNIAIDETFEYKDLQINGDVYYKDIIGVTLSNSRAKNIVFSIDNKLAPYVITKPIHATQKIIERTKKVVVFSIKVQINFELERMLLGYGDAIEIIKPEKLRKRIHKKLEQAINKYKT